jgi:hypothetical protein
MRVDVIYACEAVGSIFLVIHGLIGMVLLEHMRVSWIVRMLNIYSKVALVFYTALVLVRVSFYMDVVEQLKPTSAMADDSTTWFTGMLTVNVEN